MKKKSRDFAIRSVEAQEALLAEVWCPRCDEMDLGLDDPEEFEGNGLILLEGKCTRCGYTIIAEINEENLVY